jgi:hypothetical protein
MRRCHWECVEGVREARSMAMEMEVFVEKCGVEGHEESQCEV